MKKLFFLMTCLIASVTMFAETWEKVEPASIASSDVIVITMTKEDGTTYAMSNDQGTSKGPAPIVVTVSENKITSAVADKIQWNISYDNGKLTIYPNGTTTTWLYCTSANNGVRVGINANKEFTIDAESGYLKNTATTRYLGVYNTQDFRCYTSPTTNNIKNQTLAFYKKVVDAGSEVPATAIALNQSSLSLEQYREATLTATLTPAEATTEVTWSSDNENVATVANGVVTAVGVGSANIKATAGEGVEATCAVTVTEAVAILPSVAAEKALAGDAGKYVVEGYVAEVTEALTSYGNLTVTLADTEDGVASIKAFRAIPVTEADQTPLPGAKVRVVGNLSLYSGAAQIAAGSEFTILEAPKTPYLVAEGNVTDINFGSIEEGLTFEAQTLQITGDNLKENPEAIVLGENSVFDVTVANASLTGCDLTITCSATEPGTYNDELYIQAGTAELTISLTAAVIKIHTITWSVNGTETEVKVADGEQPKYGEEDPAAINGKVFVGWATAAIEGSTDEAPALLTSAAIPAASADATYYAVFATKTVTEGEAGWAKAELSAIVATDVVVITMTKETTTWAMPNDKWTNAPDAVEVTVSEDKITSTVEDRLKWNISNNNGELTIYPDGTTETWLYCTNANNGVKVGTGDGKLFTIDVASGYLKNEAQNRYVGVYNSQDWRCYTNTTGSTAGQTLAFFKYGNTSVTTYLGYVTTVDASGPATALENAQVEVKAVKVIENGQLVIIQNGVRYNVMGVKIQ